MRRFQRQLFPERLESLRRITESRAEHWWNDLLRLWIPSGHEAPRGLRLALRDNYMNFYLQGQSVGRVGFGRSGHPYLETHIKYAFGDGETEQRYVRLTSNEYVHPKTGVVLPYLGNQTLQKWMTVAASKAGKEKPFVDQLVAKNSTVIDLEMGLPATANLPSAPRIDLVTLERRDDRARVVFWEAKIADDSRLVARDTPEVVGQLAAYTKYLSNPEHRENVASQYARTCSLLIELHGIARLLVPDLPLLDPLVQDVAARKLEVGIDVRPRLVIREFGDANQSRLRHLERLSDEFQIPSLILGSRTDMSLKRPEVMV